MVFRSEKVLFREANLSIGAVVSLDKKLGVRDWFIALNLSR